VLGQAQEFASRLEQTIRSALPCAPTVRVQQFPDTGRVRISPVDASDPETAERLPLTCDGETLASWTFYMFAEVTDDGFLKIDRSRVALTPVFENVPVARLEFENRATGAPTSHWQFHAERGALSFILARTRRGGKRERVPMSLADLHFSNGGRRFRPGLEDFIEFLIRECGFDSRDGWRTAVEDGRELARRFQVRTIARNYPAEVAEVLKSRGWKVEPPDNFDGSESTDRLREY
jgi:hypothetical protein